MQKYSHTSRMAVGFATATMLLYPNSQIGANAAEAGGAYATIFASQASGGRPVITTSAANSGIQGDVGFADSSRQITQASATAAQTSAASEPVESVRQSTAGQPQSSGTVATDSPPAESSGGSRRSSSTASTSSSAKSPSGKGAKDIVPLRESALDSGPSFGVVAGWDSRMVYHGEDWIQRGIGSTNDSDSAGVWYARATVEWKGIAAFVGYLQSDQKVNPRDARVDSEYYSEAQAGVSYTYGVVPNILDASVGYNAYFLSSDAFIGHSYNGEAFVRLAYKQIPFITPSLTAFYFHGDSASPVLLPGGGSTSFDVEGFVYEARVDGNFKLFNIGAEGFVGLNPFVTLVVDGGIWSVPDESFKLHNLQYGLNIPIVLNSKLSFNLNVNFYQAIVDRSGLISTPDFWGGASVAYKF